MEQVVALVVVVVVLLILVAQERQVQFKEIMAEMQVDLQQAVAVVEQVQ
jgi:hypothetical protein